MDRKYPENFQIIKDPQEDNLYYAVTKFFHDAEEEYSIFAHGSTEEEARNNAISTILKCLNECHKVINNIFKNISYEKHISMREELYLPYHSIEKEFVTENFTYSSFDGLGYDKKSKTWCRFYR